MNVILRTYSSNPECNWECDYAIVTLDRPAIETIRQRLELAKSLHAKDSSFVCTEYWDRTPQYFPRFEGLENYVDLDAVDRDSPVSVPASFFERFSNDLYQITENDRMIVFRDNLYWECSPANFSDIIVETALLSTAFLRKKIAGDGGGEDS